MGYKLLGMVVWRGGKWFLARRYGDRVPSRGVLVGVGAAVAVGLGVALATRGGDS